MSYTRGGKPSMRVLASTQKLVLLPLPRTIWLNSTGKEEHDETKRGSDAGERLPGYWIWDDEGSPTGEWGCHTNKISNTLKALQIAVQLQHIVLKTGCFLPAHNPFAKCVVVP